VGRSANRSAQRPVTRRYTTAIGASKTVIELSSFDIAPYKGHFTAAKDKRVAAIAIGERKTESPPKVPVKSIDVLWAWRSSDGTVLAESARFVSFRDNLVTLVTVGSERVVVKNAELSDADRRWIREELKELRKK